MSEQAQLACSISKKAALFFVVKNTFVIHLEHSVRRFRLSDRFGGGCLLSCSSESLDALLERRLGPWHPTRRPRETAGAKRIPVVVPRHFHLHACLTADHHRPLVLPDSLVQTGP